MFIICDCSGSGSGGVGEELSKTSNCNDGTKVFFGGSGAAPTNSYKLTLPSNPVENQVVKHTDPDGVTTEYIYRVRANGNSWEILRVILPNLIIANNKDNYGILDYQWPVNNQKVYDPHTNMLYTYEQGPDSWIGIPATSLLIAQAIEENINDSELDPCPKAILGKLKNATNCDIANIFTKLNTNNVYNVNMVSGNAGNKPAKTIRDDKNKYTTTLNNQAYTSSTQLYKAANILHEITHVFFLTLVDNYYGSDDPAVFSEFPILFQTYVDTKYPKNTENKQHEEMANIYVEAIGAALQEFQTGVSLSNGAKPDEIYTDLAWGGLREAPIYEIKFPSGTAERLRIDNRLAAEQTGYVIGSGTAQEQNPIGNPCN